MKNALIIQDSEIQYISAWQKVDNLYQAVYVFVGKRIAEVSAMPFEVHPSLVWVECPDEVTAEGFAYNDSTKEFVAIPEDAGLPNVTV